MKKLFFKTFGGLSLSYYLRHFVFGALIFAYYAYLLTNAENIQYSIIIFFAISTVLYPYSRFVYESVIGFIMGDTEFQVPILVYIFSKLITMVLCWSLALFITPFGLLYLYFYHTKQEKISKEGE